jgi:hypothetical protein
MAARNFIQVIIFVTPDVSQDQTSSSVGWLQERLQIRLTMLFRLILEFSFGGVDSVTQVIGAPEKSAGGATMGRSTRIPLRFGTHPQRAGDIITTGRQMEEALSLHPERLMARYSEASQKAS